MLVLRPPAQHCSGSAAAPPDPVQLVQGSSRNALQRGTDMPLGVPEAAYSWLPGKLPPGLLFRH